MTALGKWRHYLLTSKEFEIWTDHQNLCYFWKAQKLNWRQARWVTELGEYNFMMHHKPGKTNIKADIHLRQVDDNRGEDDNKDIKVLKDEWFRRIETIWREEIAEETKKEAEQLLERLVLELEGEKRQEAIEGLARELWEEWMRSMEVEMKMGEDVIVQRIKRLMKNERRIDQAVEKALRNEEKEWEREEGMITWKNRIYMPKDRALWGDIIQAHHDEKVAGHPGRYKTQELITRNYWWPYIQSDVRWYVKGCQPCQQAKMRKGKIHALLQPNTIPEQPWEHITIDFITRLPISQGYNAIMVVVDWFTKYVIVIPTTAEISSMGTAKLFRNNVWKQFGIPWKVISDQGPQFAAQFMKDLHQLVGTKTNISTAYHPQTDSQTERMNQEIEQYLHIFMNERQTDWVDWLSLATFSYNDKEQTSTGQLPFFLNHGRHPNKGLEPRQEVKSQVAQDFINNLTKARTEAQATLTKVAETMKTFYDKKRAGAHNYDKGDKVWLEGSNITMTQPSKKLGEKWYGPFEVLGKEGLMAYRLKLPATWKKIYPGFNEALLTPYKPPVYPQQQLPQLAPPIIVEGDEEYEVDEILDSWMRNFKLQYLVRWKDYPTRVDWTWEPESNIMHAPEAIKDFHTKNPSVPWWLPLDTRTILFRQIPNDNIPIHVPQRMWSSTRKIFNWEDGIFEQHNGDWDAHPKMGVMLWTNIFNFSTYLFTINGLSKKQHRTRSQDQERGNHVDTASHSIT